MNMSKIIISSDSTCDLSAELKERYDVRIIPLGVTLGDKVYRDGIDINPDDIYAHHAKTGELPKTTAATFILTPLYWLVVVAMVALFVVLFVVLRKRIRERNNTVARRMRHADKVAVQRLRMAERFMNQGDRHGFYDELLRALWGYIGDKFNIPVSGLTKEKIREELYRRNVAEATAEQFCEIISRSEEAQYAPSATSDMNEVYAEAVEVMSKIESAVKR
jgi:hypothetical protein